MLRKLTQPISYWLQRWRVGDQSAANAVVETLDDRLRDAAAEALRGNPPDDGTGVTQLLQETWTRLSARGNRPFENREHFMSVAVLAMRALLVERHRAPPVPDPEKLPPVEERFLAHTTELDARLALQALEARYPRQARVLVQVVMGLSHAEIAEDIGRSEATVRRDLSFAKAYMKSRVEP